MYYCATISISGNNRETIDLRNSYIYDHVYRNNNSFVKFRYTHY